MSEIPAIPRKRTVTRRLFLRRSVETAVAVAVASQIPEVGDPKATEAATQAPTVTFKKQTAQNAEIYADWVRWPDRDLAQYGAYKKPGLVSPVTVAQKFDLIYKNVRGVLGRAAEYEEGLEEAEPWQGKCPGLANLAILRSRPFPANLTEKIKATRAKTTAKTILNISCVLNWNFIRLLEAILSQRS